MGVYIPTAAVASILNEQAEWEQKRQKASSKENLHKRYVTRGGYLGWTFVWKAGFSSSTVDVTDFQYCQESAKKKSRKLGTSRRKS